MKNCLLTLALLLSLAACGRTGSSTTLAQSNSCSYNGAAVEVGEKFPSEDGCNTCRCDSSGRVSCTLMACY